MNPAQRQPQKKALNSEVTRAVVSLIALFFAGFVLILATAGARPGPVDIGHRLAGFAFTWGYIFLSVALVAYIWIRKDTPLHRSILLLAGLILSWLAFGRLVPV
jgi:hypothetical protein